MLRVTLGGAVPGHPFPSLLSTLPRIAFLRMCAHYESLPDVPEPFAEYRLTWFSPRLSDTQTEMYPRYLGPVIRMRRGERGLDAMSWGLIPFWAKEPDAKRFRHNFNARAETIARIPSFSAPFLTRRCIVPAAAFVEFPILEGTKVRHRVTRADGRPILFAGLWDRWRGADDEIYSYTIITTEPSDELRWLHHRMPVILTDEESETWLARDATVLDLESLLVSPGADELCAVPA